MPQELGILFLSVLLGVVQILLSAGSSTMQRGFKWNVSSRDKEQPPLTGVAGRLQRALENFKETFPLFLGAIVLVFILQKNNSMTVLGAQMYLMGRVVYVPLYAFNVMIVRSCAWALATAGIVVILFGAILN